MNHEPETPDNADEPPPSKALPQPVVSFPAFLPGGLLGVTAND